MDTGWIKGNREDRADYRGPIRGKSQPISAKARETVRYRGRGSSRGPVCGSLDLLGAWLITRPSSSNFHSRMESMRNGISAEFRISLAPRFRPPDPSRLQIVFKSREIWEETRSRVEGLAKKRLLKEYPGRDEEFYHFTGGRIFGEIVFWPRCYRNEL